MTLYAKSSICINLLILYQFLYIYIIFILFIHCITYDKAIVYGFHRKFVK